MDDFVFHHSLNPDEIATRYASIDIECNSIDPTNGQTVAIGIGLKDTVAGEQSVDILTLGGAMCDEETLIRRAFERINEFDPTALVTFNGREFDLDYLSGRLAILDSNQQIELHCEDNHIDLFVPRKQKADEQGIKWPSLEEVLEGHGLAIQPTHWRGEQLTNKRFGEELAPKYLQAITEDRTTTVDELERLIHQYVEGDIEANLVLYETDAGRR
ncbi:3'-5' exonuclease [Haloquadratum walsbyi]|uniref:DNA polymerase elongation subunit, family B n=1 Tax=Haloquadratum walsbyi J07HQW2 TaxID=1238425 RepID=U1MZX9_9EURY|nr:3'-5' exonuclease [Haloquadratum walsbyi]ERG96084.1 MAG: DNA polymerase elongation subunit, family B [Haloquadratum walsbyi J07HQW2]